MIGQIETVELSREVSRGAFRGDIRTRRIVEITFDKLDLTCASSCTFDVKRANTNAISFHVATKFLERKRIVSRRRVGSRGKGTNRAGNERNELCVTYRDQIPEQILHTYFS